MFHRTQDDQKPQYFTLGGFTLGQLDDTIQAGIHIGRESSRLARTGWFRPSRAAGLELGSLAAAVWTADTALSFAHARRGEKVATGVASIGGHLASYASYAALRAMIPVPVVGAIIGGAAAVAVDQPMRKLLEPMLNTAVRFGEHQRRLEFASAGWRDSGVALTMRQKAAQELGSSLLNARQYLGKEALLLHQ